MTDLEKKAEEYSEKDLGNKYMSCVVAKDKLHAYKLGQYDGYIAGAKENGVVWHDLRKNPDDLPSSTDWRDWVLAVYDNGTLWCRARREEFVDGVFWVNSVHHVINKVVLWARIEIPTV